MIRRTASLSALTLTLLLAACSKNPEAAAGAEERTQSAAAAQASAGDAPAPKMNYWPVVGRLVAGNYGGECMNMQDGKKVEGPVAVSAAGKVGANGIDINFQDVKKTVLMRVAGNGKSTTSALFSMEQESAGMLTMQSGEGDKGNISLAHDNTILVCNNVPGIDKLNAQPLYMALAPFVNGKKQTIACLDTKDLLVRRDTDAEISNGIIKIGSEVFDIKASVNEMATFDDNGTGFALDVVMPDMRSVNLRYDGAGKMTHAMITNEAGSTYSCDSKQ